MAIPDLDDIVKEVIAEVFDSAALDKTERGVRPEWAEHVGWHRREDVGNLRRGMRRAPAPDGGVVVRAAPAVDPPWEDGQSAGLDNDNATPHADHSRLPDGRSVAAASAGLLSVRKARSCGLVLTAASLALCLNWKRVRRKKQAKGLI
ncbi:hypothetical protein THAOC_03776 [Thalassiosira oceanica]|uniref:Uncharacterized protein n=1 Tax=Thalassiosira oceanica TaxID=159749 RepID=K0TAK0_THAOC|nr:hypothetical protein THAOC_03776 [Thalassiosira oceanica]|eukprot:EJK74540.1 hypothetical protein THAOC_03776 [Thalassiosira oceanica]